MFKSWLRALARSLTAAALVIGTVPAAHAAQHDLILNGVVDYGQYLTQDFAGSRYDQWFLHLSGMPSIIQNDLPVGHVEVAEGDTLLVNVTLDRPFTIPGGSSTTIFSLYLLNLEPPNGQFPDVDTRVSGEATFWLNSAPAPDLADALQVGGSTRRQLAAGRAWSPDTIGAVTFDQVVMTLTIDSLPTPTPATITDAQLSYSLVNPLPPVPEPAEWALLVAGLGVIAVARRRRQRPA